MLMSFTMLASRTLATSTRPDVSPRGIPAPRSRARKPLARGCGRTAAAAKSVDAEVEAAVLERAYAACADYTRESSATFYFATALMRRRQRRSVQAIYSWCRILDETVDSVEAAEAGADVAAAKLRAIETQLKRIFASSSSSSSSGEEKTTTTTTTFPSVSPSSLSSSPETIALADTIRNTPGMSPEPFLDMITGMRSDLSYDPDALDEDESAPGVPWGSSPQRFKDWPELRRYCYNVAGTVGLMTLPVMGVADGYTVEDATPAGVELGIALQLTNILRDVGEDARRGRLYLPLDAVAAAGLTPQEVMSGAAVGDERYEALIEGEIRRAEEHFERAAAGVPMLAPAAKLPVLAAAEIYGALLDKVRENKYDNYTKRAYTTTREKLAALPGLAWRAWFSR